MLRREYLVFRLRQSRTGLAVLELVNQHREEVDMLVRNYTKISLNWKRLHGPLFISEGLKVAPDQDLHFIQEVEGVSLGYLIRKMATVFLRHASPDLSRVIEDNLAYVLQLARTHRGIADVFEYWKEQDPVI